MRLRSAARSNTKYRMRVGSNGAGAARLLRNSVARGKGRGKRLVRKRGNKYLRKLFVHAAWVVLVKPQSWGRHGLKSWIEAARKRRADNGLLLIYKRSKSFLFPAPT
jgi:transposase